MKRLVLLFLAIAVFSCNNSSTNFTLQGHIKGLKKGTVYLQKIADTTFVTVDSTTIKGESNFELHCQLDEPEVVFVKLDKNAKEDEFLRVFASEGITTLNTTLKNFVYDAEINGSEQQELLEDYTKMMRKFNNKNLDLIDLNLKAQVANDSVKADSLEQVMGKMHKSRYLYSLNYAINHKNSEIAPYIAVAEMPDATEKVLDTLYNSLEDNIKTSKYGKLLKEVISE